MRDLRFPVSQFVIAAAVAAALILAAPAGASVAAHFSAGGGFHGSSFHHGGSFRHGASFRHGGSFHNRYCFGCGWHGPWGWWGWGYYGDYPYGYSRYADGRAYRGQWAAVKTDVEPDEAALYLDGRLIGTADDFDGYPDMLYLRPGSYTLEFKLEGFESLSVTVDASTGRSFRIDRRLKKIPGARRHGTYSPARPEGGIVRYFAKRDGVAVPYVPDGRDSRESSGRRGRTTPLPGRDDDEDAQGAIDEGAPRTPGSSSYEIRTPEAEAEDSSDQAPAAPESSSGIAAAGESRILFHVEPGDAAVYLDDRFAGSARDLNSLAAGLPVSAGEHRVTVTRPGYHDKEMKIEVGEKEKPRLDIALSR